mmetsp:Transcript_17374/g.59593  ORF Transcript_17374/g.59593 Transcript_17374/m.59593 type:complete len:116 (+) Transcript_17374:96-443(+)
MHWDDVFADAGTNIASDTIVHAWRGPGGSPVRTDPFLVDATRSGFRDVSSHGLYLTAGDGVDAETVVRWQGVYDRDLLAPFTERDEPRHVLDRVLGAEVCMWGEKIDEGTFDAVA